MLWQIAHLALVGGLTADECARKIMDKILDNDLVLNHFTWVGRNDNKQAFQPLMLRNVVVGKTRVFCFKIFMF
jgi:hypothetical protein